MTPDDFARTSYLRATGYNFYVWAVGQRADHLAVVRAPWPGIRGRSGSPCSIRSGCILGRASSSPCSTTIASTRCAASPIRSRSSRPAVSGGRFFSSVLVFTVVLSLRGPAAYMQPVWLLLVGCAYLTWGNFGVREFQLF